MVKRTGKHRAQRSLLSSVAVAVAIFLTGYLFVTNLRVNRTAFVTSNTSQMVERNSQRTKSLREDIKDLDSRISLLNKTLVSSNENKDSSDTGFSYVIHKI